MAWRRLLAVGGLFLVSLFLVASIGAAQTASDKPATAPPYLSDPRLDVKKLKSLSEMERKDAQQLADKIRKAIKDSAAGKPLPIYLQTMSPLHHLELALKDPLYPAKVRAAAAVAGDYFEQTFPALPPRGGRAGLAEQRHRQEFKKAITNVVMRVILEKNFGIEWVGAGFPDWWLAEPLPGLEIVRPALPAIEN